MSINNVDLSAILDNILTDFFKGKYTFKESLSRIDEEIDIAIADKVKQVQKENNKCLK